MKFICPLVVVEDIKKSRYLYENILGQVVKMDFGENITFEGDFAIHQKKHFSGLINNAPISTKSNNFELYFEDDDLESILSTLKSNGFEFVHEIIEQPWQQKVMRFYDYDKNLIEIGERMEHLAYRLSKKGYPIDKIATITYMPEEFLLQEIKQYEK